MASNPTVAVKVRIRYFRPWTVLLIAIGFFLGAVAASGVYWWVG